MKVGIYTLGCKVNAYESEFIISLFNNRGYEIVSFDDDCDVYIVNTCTVTNNSDRKDRKIINSIKNKNACKVVCGCFVESAKDYDFTGIDVVIGNYNKSDKTGIRLTTNKRNGRKQSQHVKIMNAIREIEHPDGEWRNKNGAPEKKEIVEEWQQLHPNGKKSECIKDTGLSKPTVYKWWRKE